MQTKERKRIKEFKTQYKTGDKKHKDYYKCGNVYVSHMMQ